MDQLNILDRKILLVLQNYPLESFSTLAEKLKISPQTMIRRINALKENKILFMPVATFIPERISLTRYFVTLNISSLHQFTYLQMVLAEYNYIRSYNRFYGEKFGIVAIFDLPEEIKAQFIKYLDYLVEQEYCDSYVVDKAMGYRVNNPESLTNYSKDPKIFNLIGYWEKRKDKSEALPRLPSPVKLETLEPLHMLLLRDLTNFTKNGVEISIRAKQTELIDYYKKYYIHLGKKIRMTDNEKQVYINLSEFFDTRNKHNIKVDFGRKYYNVVRHHLISNPRWNFSRKLFEQHVTRAFIIKGVPKNEKAQIFRLLHEETAPFETGFELLNDGLFLRFAIPPYYDSKLNYLIWNTFKDYQVCSLDFFGKHGAWWPFYLENYNWDTKYWKIDDDWAYNSVLSEIDNKLKANNFGDIKLNKHLPVENGNGNSNGSYLYKHISNGSLAATTP